MTSFLLIGLGNPGAQYRQNRHNVGFLAVDAIAERHEFGPETHKFHGLLREGKIGEHKVFAFKPQTFMNASGQPAGDFVRFYKIPLDNIIVFHDDLDLKLGKQRVKRGGGNGGHNGLKSLDRFLGADYLRARLGIGHPGDKNLVADHVLSNFTGEEMPTVKKLVGNLADHLPVLLYEGPARFMNTIALMMRT